MTATTPLAPGAAQERVLRLGAITHVALTVRELDISVPWYRAVTGTEPVLDEDTGPFRHVVFALGDTLLGLHAFPDPVNDVAFDPRRPGLDHVAFGCADPDELSAWATRLDDLGIGHGEAVHAHYGHGLAFTDPDGLALELFCPPSSAG
jgi:catechol-2,3-dioxygenase